MVNLHPVLLNKWYSVQRVMIYKIIKHSKVFFFFLKKKKKGYRSKKERSGQQNLRNGPMPDLGWPTSVCPSVRPLCLPQCPDENGS